MFGRYELGGMRDWSSKRRSGKSEPTVFPNAHDAIIHEELWNTVQAVNKVKSENHTSYSNLKGEFILTGLLRFPMYGAGTVMIKSEKRDGSGYHLYYMCQTYHSCGITECKTNLIKKRVG
ncbi:MULTISPECIES: recombinase family protein [Paenibacillus]|uniref:recombinase family protein n=1 Tax=Paenibacillus TaxID=44249 RepID=UPI00351BE962